MSLSLLKRPFLNRKRIGKLLLQCALSAAGLTCADAQGIYNFYGTTGQGGPNGSGTIFRTSATGTNLQAQYTFPSDAPGINPTAGLTAYNGKLYGLATYGGVNGNGVLFEFDTATHAYVKKADFNDATTGSGPYGGLLLYNNKLYGTTTSGGTNGYGVLFKYDPATATLSNIAEFDYTNTGAYPQGAPVAYGGNLYGTAYSGGANGDGVIYEYDFSTDTLLVVADFSSGTTGAAPQSDLIVYNSKLYGTASQGGANNYGNLFEFDPGSASLTNIADFDYTLGAYPIGSLVEDSGILYGLSSGGGSNSAGTLYQYDPSTDTLSNIADLDYSTVGGGALSALTTSGFALRVGSKAIPFVASSFSGNAPRACQGAKTGSPDLARRARSFCQRTIIVGFRSLASAISMNSSVLGWSLIAWAASKYSATRLRAKLVIS